MIIVPFDLHPLEAAARLQRHPGRFFLDSGSNADGCGHWSFVGANPNTVLRLRVNATQDPFLALAQFAHLPSEAQDSSDGPWPYVVGYLGYELRRAVERLPHRTIDDRHIPHLWMGSYDAVWRFDHTTGCGHIGGTNRRAVDQLAQALSTPLGSKEAPLFGPLRAQPCTKDYYATVQRALAYIQAGDIYQVNLARHLTADVRILGDPLALYRRVAAIAPAPFGALLECDDFAVLSNSPELFLRREPGSPWVETRPIKGTRARSCNPVEDAHLMAELSADAKEQAEHLMIVDLMRNDLGRVAQIGTVHVDGFARTVSLPTVHHLVSTVRAQLKDGAGIADVLRATFPGGSITGAPKIRAMEIIDELEPVARGVYTGALGYIGRGGEWTFAMAIRTAVLTLDRLHFHVGGGIVAESHPNRELEETEEKALAWRRVLAATETDPLQPLEYQSIAMSTAPTTRPAHRHAKIPTQTAVLRRV